ncbi:TetR/AcrR family transcriptional regulator [Actinoplanes sp. RD1]|uniref:TetR/AcrR family transcriptional regulator n=1 Tax=Actinoplanes sp. RD1 TaxID=3064538 RepID=UPI002740C6A0|nr:TetR/AcrR family transcriptional regulator [Actinoplanes sp. RD1]
MRPDVEEKQNRILAAARHAFAEAGEDVPTTRIARRAGVSVATVYRRFPTRHELVAAAFTDQWDECAARQDAALHDSDPARALRTLVRAHCAHELRDRGFTRHFADAVAAGRGLEPQRRETERVLSVLLERARAQGAVRADLGVADFRLLVAAHRGVIAAAGPAAAAASRRYLTLMLRSFQP